MVAYFLLENIIMICYLDWKMLENSDQLQQQSFLDWKLFIDFNRFHFPIKQP